MRILISRTDSIGDVILTLPLCGWIKKNIEGSQVIFLCSKLTKPIIERSSYVDEIYVWDGTLPEVDAIIHVFPNKSIAVKAKKNGIKDRIGSSHRIYHWWTCNHTVNFTRIKSNLHEAQLNFKLLGGLGSEFQPELQDLHKLIGWKIEKRAFKQFLDPKKFNLVFHIKSRGSAKEWKSSNYLELAKKLPKEKINLILTGTQAESDLIQQEIPEIFELGNVANSTGQLSLEELVSLIGQADGLLACSTGPLHIAAVSGIRAFGLYPSKKPMHAGRWAPLGPKAEFIEENVESDERLLKIEIEEVEKRLKKWL